MQIGRTDCRGKTVAKSVSEERKEMVEEREEKNVVV